MTRAEIDKAIQRKFRPRAGDSLPLRGKRGRGRQHVAQLFNKLGYKRGAEIGVAKGRNSKRLCARIPDLELICVDPWGRVDYSPEGDRVVKISTGMARERLALARKELAPYNIIWKQKPSMEAVREVEDDSLDFVHIDGGHDFDNVMLDIIHWSQKVRTGGIVSGHDYCIFYRAGVISAVNAYTAANGIAEWYVTAELRPTWFWVK